MEGLRELVEIDKNRHQVSKSYHIPDDRDKSSTTEEELEQVKCVHQFSKKKGIFGQEIDSRPHKQTH